jgi:predicted HAD superfamily Cof-like phosphohydrolase
MRTKTNYEKVREFHQAFGQPLDEDITESDYLMGLNNRLEDLFNLFRFRMSLIEEEYNEVRTAILDEDVLKELADLLYVTYGFAATFGWDIDTAFNRVHQSNMSKLGEDGKPIYREDGKVLKGPNYAPPDLSDLV